MSNSQALSNDDFEIVAQSAGGPDVLAARPLGALRPGPGQALVRQSAVGLNFIDVYHRSGLYPPPGGAFPAVLGGEGAGTVEEVGEGVDHLSPGDRVAYFSAGGAYATRRLIAADRLVRLPEGVSERDAAGAMLKGLTAQYLIHDSYRAQPGDTVLVHAAAGGVGLILGDWLKAKGVTAIGTAGGPDKVALAMQHGFAHVIDYRASDFVEETRRLTGGAGVAAVYDSVGQDTYPGSLKVLRRFGSFISFGQSSGPITDFKLADLAANGSLYAQRPTLFQYADTRDELERRTADLFDAIASGAVRIEIGQTFPLAQVADAHKALEARETTGQTVLTVEAR